VVALVVAAFMEAALVEAFTEVDFAEASLAAGTEVDMAVGSAEATGVTVATAMVATAAAITDQVLSAV
jgi:hypothetical protein